MLQSLSRFLFKCLGWTVIGQAPKEGRYVVIAAPHTSNYDFILLVGCAWATGVKISWLGKKEMFQLPVVGWFFRKMGGIAIDRSKSGGYVDKLADMVRQQDNIKLCIPPEGTRSRRDGWKTGFYHIAHTAQVPVLMAFIDYGQKRVGVGPILHLSGDIDADFKRIREFYEPIRGRFPNNESPIVPLKKSQKEMTREAVESNTAC